jgi:hypothetical protein
MIVHVVFGSESHRGNYARNMAVNPRLVVMATQPAKLMPLMTDEVKEIKIVRVPKEMWVAPTFPCEQRVKETEAMIKGYRRLGVTVTEVEY